MMGSLQLGSPCLGSGLFGSLSTIEEIGETGSGDSERITLSGVTGHGPRALLGCSSCNKEEAATLESAFTGEPSSCFP